MPGGPPEEAPEEEVQSWASEELGGVAFKDERLPKRLAKVVLAMFHNPMASIKAACRGAAEAVGAYRFFGNENAPGEQIVAGHRRRAVLRAQGHGRVLAIQGTSEADFTKKKKLEGTGPGSTARRSWARSPSGSSPRPT